MLRLGQFVWTCLDIGDNLLPGEIVGRRYAVGGSVTYYVIGSRFDGWFAADELREGN